MAAIPNRRVAFGPELPEFGSWNWLASDLIPVIQSQFEVSTFREGIPPAEIVVFFKFLPELQTLRDLAARSRVVFCPVDIYGSSGEIDSDVARLRHCHRVVVHCERLTRHFSGYAPVAAMDHQVKYVAPMRSDRYGNGPLLWIGEQSNLPVLINWVNGNSLEHELIVLTNTIAASAVQLGFHKNCDVSIQKWSPELHVRLVSQCRAALDIKGTDFRARHKPPAKACDFLASGVPLAMNPESSSTEFLARRGFELATPTSERWLSQDYLEECKIFGRRLVEELSLPSIAVRWQTMLSDVLMEPIGERRRDR